ncbi:prp 4 CRoW domain-containing protein [Metarhizium rileyi]|uniref:Prp 4 CRoW domain-containing protein n=1 Tax=Metarhizium rileyi (strain RCEF 4871) TaxID=1649241 RepID=A0A167H9L8_METRR|nr:prp 4 CRoW domain-containing protein [Metarhizium rileyi RCEF 4871]
MLFQTVASVALLATGAAAAASEARQPYRLAVMALPGQSLMRRDTGGYQPDQKHCKAGNTCAEACGAEYSQCPGGKPDVAHCFKPSAGESCCTDNSGNSCEAGFYCTHDSKAQTWCCPNSMDLTACAAAYTVTGLVAATSKPPPPSTSQTPTITSVPETTTTSTSSSSSSSSSSIITSAIPPIVTSTIDRNITICVASCGNSTASTAMNSTTATRVSTQPSMGLPSVSGVSTPAPTNVSAAAASGVSALLLVAAAAVALL